MLILNVGKAYRLPPLLYTSRILLKNVRVKDLVSRNQEYYIDRI